MIAVIVPKCLMAGKWMIIVQEHVTGPSSFVPPMGEDRRSAEEAEDKLSHSQAMAPEFLSPPPPAHECPRCRGRCLTFRVLVNKVLVKEEGEIASCWLSFTVCSPHVPVFA